MANEPRNVDQGIFSTVKELEQTAASMGKDSTPEQISAFQTGLQAINPKVGVTGQMTAEELAQARKDLRKISVQMMIPPNAFMVENAPAKAPTPVPAQASTTTNSGQGATPVQTSAQAPAAQPANLVRIAAYLQLLGYGDMAGSDGNADAQKVRSGVDRYAADKGIDVTKADPEKVLERMGKEAGTDPKAAQMLKDLSRLPHDAGLRAQTVGLGREAVKAASPAPVAAAPSAAPSSPVRRAEAPKPMSADQLKADEAKGLLTVLGQTYDQFRAEASLKGTDLANKAQTSDEALTALRARVANSAEVTSFAKKMLEKSATQDRGPGERNADLRGADVRALQWGLKASGQDVGAFGINKNGVDGIMGSVTTGATMNVLPGAAPRNNAAASAPAATGNAPAPAQATVEPGQGLKVPQSTGYQPGGVLAGSGPIVAGADNPIQDYKQAQKQARQGQEVAVVPPVILPNPTMVPDDARSPANGGTLSGYGNGRFGQRAPGGYYDYARTCGMGQPQIVYDQRSRRAWDMCTGAPVTTVGGVPTYPAADPRTRYMDERAYRMAEARARYEQNIAPVALQRGANNIERGLERGGIGGWAQVLTGGIEGFKQLPIVLGGIPGVSIVRNGPTPGM